MVSHLILPGNVNLLKVRDPVSLIPNFPHIILDGQLNRALFGGQTDIEAQAGTAQLRLF